MLREEKRVAFFLSEYSLGTNDSLINSLEELAENGYACDVFIYKPDKVDMVVFNVQNINIHVIEDKPEIPGWSYLKKVSATLFSRIAGKILKKINMEGFIKPVTKSNVVASLIIPTYVIKKTKNLMSDNYICFFGVEARGLIFANFVNTLDLPVFYLSLEIYYKGHPHLRHDFKFLICKEFEANYHKSAVATIVQNNERANLLLKENLVEKTGILYLPVSIRGKPYRKKTDYLYKKLGIPKDKKIIVQFGLIHRYRKSLEIAQAVQNFPEEYAVVFHGYGCTDEYIRKIKGVNINNKVYLSLETVEYHRISELLASCHIGLAFFPTDNMNDLTTGSSSGRLAHYLHCGLPVIVNDIPSINIIMEEYKCGFMVKRPDELCGKVTEIFEDYDYYRDNAFRCYEERYEFSKHFKDILNRIDILSDLNH